MSAVRPPSFFSNPEPKDPLAAALEQEVMSEKAGTLARLMRVLEQKMARLDGYERRVAAGERAEDGERRRRLVAEAGEALWHVVIQRELCGLRRHDGLMRELAIPAAVRLAMGPAPKSASSR